MITGSRILIALGAAAIGTAFGYFIRKWEESKEEDIPIPVNRSAISSRSNNTDGDSENDV